MAAGIVVTFLVAAAVVVIGTSFLGDDATISGSEVADAFMIYERAVTYGDDGYAELAECPVGDPVELASRIADVIDLDASILAGEVFVDAYETGDGYPAITQCFLTADPEDGLGATSVGFSVSGVPVGSYRDFLTDEAYDFDIDVTIDVQRRWEEAGWSGDLFAYCYRAADLSGCGADLVDRYNGVVLSVYLQGPERAADEVVRSLDVVVERMATNLQSFAADNPAPATVPPAGLDG